MTLDARLEQLGRRHQALQSEIDTEMKHPALNEVRVHDLKRRKLVIKDEIQSLQTRMTSGR